MAALRAATGGSPDLSPSAAFPIRSSGAERRPVITEPAKEQPMGEAKRRREINRGLKGMHAEGQGIWNLMIYNPADVAGVMRAAAVGDAYARGVVRSLEHMIQGVLTAQPPMMCLTCDSEFTREAMPEAWVLMHAHRNEPEKALGNGICAACHARYPGAALLPVVTDVYRKELINDLRVLPPMSEAGRA
jgi:hypothetical protein